MRFAYIDSQGKEVGIPSVEALQLRIELGAIVSSTMFFDASSDRWAPAREHEIFRTLQRELTEKDEGGFVPPPPVLDSPAPQLPKLDPDSVFVTDPFEEPGAHEPSGAPLELDPGPFADQDRIADRGSVDPGGFTLAPIADEEPRLSNDLEVAAPRGDPLGGGFEITPITPTPHETPSSEPELPPAGEGTFNFDSFGTVELGGGVGEPDAPARPSDLKLESRLSDQDVGGQTTWKGGLDLEPPMSDYLPEGPPGWADEDGGVAEPGEPPQRGAPDSPAPAGPRQAAAVGTDAPRGPRGAPARPAEAPRRRPRSRPQGAPRATSRPARSSPATLIATLFILALAGGGGWFGWSFFHGRGTGSVAGYEPVEIPALPAELEGTFRELAGGTLDDLVDSLGAQWAEAGLAPEPPADWLAGQYLANASRYPNVSAYWSALSQALASLRSQEEAIFGAAFEARMASARLAPEARTALLERAVAGFRAALPERDRSYEQLAAVFVASLGLHEFLLENEESIDYEPAAGGISRDPVLEAVPATKALGDEMWRRVDMITAALEAMGALTDRVTTQRLFSLTLERVATTPVR